MLAASWVARRSRSNETIRRQLLDVRITVPQTLFEIRESREFTPILFVRISVIRGNKSEPNGACKKQLRAFFVEIDQA